MTGAIYAKDFSDRVTDVNRETWTPNTIQWVVEALEGREVLIEVDRGTGFMQKGRLTGYSSSGLCGGASATVHVAHEFGTTRFLLFKIGVIVDLEGSAKWKALDLRRRAERAAHEAAVERFGYSKIDDVWADERYVEVYGIGDRTYDVSLREKGGRPLSALKRERLTV